jgi:hypothetical protein
MLDKESQKQSLEQNSLSSSILPGNATDSVGMFEFSVYDMTGRVRTIAADSGDRTHDYSDVNSMGYRSDELKQADLITIGCSQTFGVGVCPENTWGAVLSRELNMSHANLSFIGWSLTTGITAAYAHIREHGAPKVIAILSPDFYRISWIMNRSIHASDRDSRKPPREDTQLGDMHLTELLAKDMPAYSKAPHIIQDIMPPEVSYYQNFWALNSFVEYCRLANIKLVVQTWEHNLEKLFISFGLVKDFFISRDPIGVGKNSNCNVNHTYGNTSHPDEIEEGTDKHGRDAPHMGAHEHWHVATEMAEFLKKA